MSEQEENIEVEAEKIDEENLTEEQQQQEQGIEAEEGEASEESEKSEKITPIEPPREPIDVTITDIELEELTAERDDYKKKYLMSLAELENFRKRSMKERDELIQYAIANVLTDFLQPLDSFEKALGFAENMSDEVKHWAKGFEMILGQMHESLANHGVVGFDSVGMEFDPEFHEAVEAEETEDHPPGKILIEFVKGYKLGKRTLRPARVKVAKELKKNNDEIKDDNNQQGEVS